MRGRAVAWAVSVSMLLAGCGAADQEVGAEPSDPTVPVVASGTPGHQSWAPWPSALHDARHSGASPGLGPQQGVEVWRRHLSTGALPAGPVVGSVHMAFLVDNAGTLHAVDLSDGRDRWTADTGQAVSGDLSVSPLVLPDGDVVASSTGGLSAWTSSGRHRWTVELTGSLTSPVTKTGARIYVGSTSGEVSAIDLSRGKPKLAWTVDIGDQSYGSVVTNGDGRVYTTSAFGLVAIDDLGARGKIAWTAEPDDDLVEVSAGLAADGTVLLGTNGSHEWAYNTDGRPLWNSPRRITYSSPSVTDDGLAYIGEHNNVVHVFAVASGKEVGRYSTVVKPREPPSQVWTSVVVDSRHDLYFGTRPGWLVGVRADGQRLFTFDLGASTASYPALTGDGKLLIATEKGDLVLVR